MEKSKIKKCQNPAKQPLVAAGQVAKGKSCQNCKASFVIEKEDFEFYEKIDVPEPTFCPDCRMQRRMVWRTNMNLYMRKVEGIKGDTLSYVPPDSPMKVHDYKKWWSNEMDAMKFARDYDFEKPFFEQIRELMSSVGLPHLNNFKNVNSDFSNNTYGLKDCYLVFNCGLSENCAYGTEIESCKDCFNCNRIYGCELCCECSNCQDCYQTLHSRDCQNCTNIYFSKNCVGCHECFGCVNLKHKKYHIFNKPYSKEEYFAQLKNFDVGSYEKLTKTLSRAKEFWMKHPVRFMQGSKNDNVSGDVIYNSKNAKNCFSCKDLEDCSYCQLILFWPSKQCQDIAVAGGELCYELEEAGGFRANFCWLNMPKDLKNNDAGLFNMDYSIGNLNSHDLFGCVGLRHKHHCILNKQYTKEEYEGLVPKIKQHMNEMPFVDKKGRVYKYGEFLPPELSPFGYNETIAQEYFPLTKEQALEKGYKWYDKPKSEYEPTVKAKDLPDHIENVDKKILDEVIECQNTSSSSCQGSGAFRIIPAELEFYQKHSLPVPRLCPDCRHTERIRQRNPMKLWERQCMCSGKQDTTKTYQNQQEHFHKEKQCPNTFKTTYAPERPEIVYCKECYQKEVE